MLAIHMIAVFSVVFVFLFMCMIYAGKDHYEEVHGEFYRKFNEDLEYTISIMRDLTLKESEKKIDEFEAKWMNYIRDHEMKQAIGRLIDAQYRETLFS